MQLGREIAASVGPVSAGTVNRGHEVKVSLRAECRAGRGS